MFRHYIKTELYGIVRSKRNLHHEKVLFRSQHLLLDRSLLGMNAPIIDGFAAMELVLRIAAY